MNHKLTVQAFADRDMGDEATVMAYCESGDHDVELFEQRHQDEPGVIDTVPDDSLAMCLGIITLARCDECLSREGERAEARSMADYYGGSSPQTADERHLAAWEQKRGLR
mgnify:CR=1 FL=1